MFGKLPLLINDDWVNGNVFNDVLVEPVRVARNVLKGSDHKDIYSLWESIEHGFDEWKEQQSHLPVKNPLEVNSAIDYEAARTLYFQHASKVLSPEDVPMLFATVLLEAASRCDEKAAHKAYQQLVNYRRIAEMEDVSRDYEFAIKHLDRLTEKLNRYSEGQRKGAKAVASINESTKAKNEELVFKSAKKYMHKVAEHNLIGSIIKDTKLTRPTVTDHLEELRKAKKLPKLSKKA